MELRRRHRLCAPDGLELRGDRPLPDPLHWKLERDGLHFWVAECSSIWPQRCGVQTLCFTLARGRVAPPSTSVAPAGPVSFRFTVEGSPVSAAGLGSGYETTVADGRGSLTAAGAATGTSVVFHVHRTGEGELTELAVTGSRQRSATRLVLDASVRSSTVPGCAVGARGTLVLVNDTVDEVIVAVCGRSSRYRDGGDNDVRVTLTRR